MKNTIWIFLLIFAFSTFGFAQQGETNTAGNNEKDVILKAGTKLSARLKQTLDVEKLKSGDDFMLTLMDDVAGNGMTFSKGTELLGRVVRVQTVSADEKVSEISLSFDFLKVDDDYLRFKAGILSGTDETAAVSTGNNNPELVYASSPVFKGATVISLNGKNIVLQEGLIFKLELDLDLKKP